MQAVSVLSTAVAITASHHVGRGQLLSPAGSNLQSAVPTYDRDILIPSDVQRKKFVSAIAVRRKRGAKVQLHFLEYVTVLVHNVHDGTGHLVRGLRSCEYRRRVIIAARSGFLAESEPRRGSHILPVQPYNGAVYPVAALPRWDSR